MYSKMSSRERVLSSCKRKGYDRIPVKHEGTPEVNQMLREYFGLKNDEQLLLVLGDDFRYVRPKYCGPEIKKYSDGTFEGYFGERYTFAKFEGGEYLESVYKPYKGVLELKDLDESHFPKSEWFDYSNILEDLRKIHDRGFSTCIGQAGDINFINGISDTRGMEQVMMDLIDNNPVFLRIMEARFDFYYEKHEKMLKEGRGLIDFAHIGDDLGTQTGPMVSMEIYNRHFAPKYKKYFEMVHSYGARTMMHVCGTVWPFLDRLIEIGLDVYDVVQPTTPENDIGALAKNFGDRLIFQGSVDVQKELAFGTVEEVKMEVRRRLELFPKGGFIMGPSHAIQPKSPIENILTLYRESNSLMETIPDWLYDIEGSGKSGTDPSELLIGG